MKLDRTANILGALALCLSDEIRAAGERRAGEGGPAPAAVVLVGHEPGLSIDRLRRALGMSHPGAVRLVDRLAADGLLARTPSAADGRAVALVLTPAGTALRDAILAERHRSLRTALGRLEPAELERLDEIVAKVLGGLVRGEAHAYAVCRLCDERACGACPVEGALERREAG